MAANVNRKIDDFFKPRDASVTADICKPEIFSKGKHEPVSLPSQSAPPYPDLGNPEVYSNINKECIKLSILKSKWVNCSTYDFPSRLIGKKQRKLNQKWFQDHEWLRYSEKTDSLFCAYCALFGPTDSKIKSFGLQSPVSDWSNLSNLVKRHIESKPHIDNSLTAEDFLSIAGHHTPSILKSISASHEETVRRNRHILKCIIEVLLTLAKQNIAIRGHTEDRSNFFALLHLCAKSDEVLADHLANAADNSKYTSPDIQNELIEICGKEVKEVLLKECREAPYFALLADETTDKSTRVQLSVCVRYVEISDEAVFVKETF